MTKPKPNAQVVVATAGEEQAGVMHVGRANDEQIEKWRHELEDKQLAGTVHEISVDVFGNGKELGYGYVHEPERVHLAKVMTLMSKGETLQAGEYILNNLWLGGDERLRRDKWPSFNAAIQVSSIVEFRDTTVKKR